MTTARSSPPDEPTPTRPPLARLVELAVSVPVEVTCRLVDAVPAVVDKVPSAAERVRREVILARFLGKMVVDQGVREVRARLTPHDDEAVVAPVSPVSPVAPVAPVVSATDTAEVEVEHEIEAGTEQGVDGEAPLASSLALADYDHLSSAQVVGKLEGLDAAERAAIERYERAGRCRRTILGKLAQLEAHQ